MGFKPVIRQNDVDSGGDRQQNTQSNFLVDEGGNLQLKGSIDGSGAGAGGGITWFWFCNSSKRYNKCK